LLAFAREEFGPGGQRLREGLFENGSHGSPTLFHWLDRSQHQEQLGSAVAAKSNPSYGR
jgi:hypothetical protein